MTHQPSSPTSPKRSAGQSTNRRFPPLSIGAAMGAALAATMLGASSAEAEVTNTSYHLGYAHAVASVQRTAAHMRAEGFDLGDIVISSRIPALCARETTRMQGVSGLNDTEFFRGCTDGMVSMVEIGVAY